MKQAYETLISFPSIGKFLGFQFLIDLNYGSGLSFSEMDFVVAGPGAHDGIRKCFGPAAAGIEDEVISWTTATQEQHFDRVGVDFRSLFGRRLQLIDAQNLFCEVDKYARVVHPNIDGISGRTRIKQKFAPQAAPAVPVFPPKWGLEPRSGLARRG